MIVRCNSHIQNSHIWGGSAICLSLTQGMCVTQKMIFNPFFSISKLLPIYIFFIFPTAVLVFIDNPSNF